MKRVVVESPFGRNEDGSKCTPEEYARNIRYLNRALLDSARRGDESPYASHRFFPGLLDDTDPEERKHGMAMGLVWSRAGELWAVYVDHGITEGMQNDIALALELGRPIEHRYIGPESMRDTMPAPELPHVPDGPASKDFGKIDV